MNNPTASKSAPAAAPAPAPAPTPPMHGITYDSTGNVSGSVASHSRTFTLTEDRAVRALGVTTYNTLPALSALSWSISSLNGASVALATGVAARNFPESGTVVATLLWPAVAGTILAAGTYTLTLQSSAAGFTVFANATGQPVMTIATDAVTRVGDFRSWGANTQVVPAGHIVQSPADAETAKTRLILECVLPSIVGGFGVGALTGKAFKWQ
jgi:hypothetical protein